MNRKTLAIELSKLKKLASFNPYLEQYQTDSEIAAEMLWIAYMNGDINNKTIADFGSGNGILGIGALILGAKKVFFIEIDKKSIDLLKSNLNSNPNFNENDYEVLNIDIKDFKKHVDTVVENPPFGVQKVHSDKIFLETAFKYSEKVYSLHKIESIDFIKDLSEEFDFDVNSVLNMKFIIKKSMHFHKKEKYPVDIGLWIISKKIEKRNI